jgi:N-acetylneuraminic acid mutarotase
MKDASYLSILLGGSVSGSRRAATISLRRLLRSAVLILLSCVCLTAAAQTDEWVWVGGSNAANQPGVYGTLGTPAAGNIPAGRQWAATWTDKSGKLWLFGGQGATATGGAVFLNDLWVFDPSTKIWGWEGGSSTATNQPGIYGTKGTPAAGNIPGARDGAMSWTDNAGNLWLFGGMGLDSGGNTGELNDLWKFNPSTKQWAWMAGNNTNSSPGIYGSLGKPATGNTPGSRLNPVGWKDQSGNFWLFGGGGYDAKGNSVLLNDLWEFTPSTNQWTWVGGSSTISTSCSTGPCGQSGSYGSLGTPAAGNIPGSRFIAVSWIDQNGDFWLFGGSGYDAKGQQGWLNDMWKFNPASKEWAWMGGSETLPPSAGTACTNNCGQSGVYGTQGTPAPGNIPGGRMGAAKASAGYLWLFGGVGYDSSGQRGYLNDLWKFNPATNEWTWMGGSNNAINQPGVYGTEGTPAAGNVPGGRQMSAVWADNRSRFWLFGGANYDTGSFQVFNDLWEYQPYGPPQVITGTAVKAPSKPAPQNRMLTLSATVEDFGVPAQAWFVVGTTPKLVPASSTSTPKKTLPASVNKQPVSTEWETPLPTILGPTFYFQAWASTAGGTSHGSIQSFTIK